MKNDLFTIGSITIHGYGLMIGIGIIAAYYLAEYRANKRGMDVDMILSIAICGVVCGILGAKLLYYVTIFDEILANPKKLLDINDGFVVYGGIIGGVLGGYECVDFKVTLLDGSYHEVDSSEMAYKIAGSMAFKEGARKADPVLLEPVMKVEVVMPEEYMGDIIGNINSRRGRVEGMESRPGVQVVKAIVPLGEMFGYATDLRSRTQGRGVYTMQFSHYEEVPKSIAEKVIKK